MWKTEKNCFQLSNVNVQLYFRTIEHAHALAAIRCGDSCGPVVANISELAESLRFSFPSARPLRLYVVARFLDSLAYEYARRVVLTGPGGWRHGALHGLTVARAYKRVRLARAAESLGYSLDDMAAAAGPLRLRLGEGGRA